jgi:hypothetical protein
VRFQAHQNLFHVILNEVNESMLSLTIWLSLLWILRRAQDDKPGLKTPAGGYIHLVRLPDEIGIYPIPVRGKNGEK